ncbi:MAG: endonuclease/exonuclease/phosphatase family protein [Candidatus Marinimicrobia bacterium]|jgi:endonuclease/exonuclease/phosphatase family metal-dependent hydrolase|nr:endonuclease/exonuclease/phosphatase family protein [Candidatus Neomarinimicrobiota bacterium]
MEKLLRNFLIIFFIISCSGGGESSPTDPDNGNGGDTSNPYELPNAVNYNIANQVEVVTWNIRQFPQHSTSVDYVKNLLEKWNADIYFFQEINSESSLITMVNSMPNYSYVVDEESGNLGFALVYKNEYITYNSKNELWADTANNDDGDSDYENNAAYQFADRPPMESYLTWTDGTKSIDLYVIGVHYKCCGDDSYDASDTGDETTRRHHASLLLTDYIINNRSNDNVIVLGDFNNTGSQSIVNPTLSPFTDQNNYDSATSFKMTDLSILQGPATGYSWQGWTSSYSAAHFDHIIINQSMFTVDATSATSVIALPTETGLSNSNVSNRISDHQPVMYRFYP